MSDRVGPEEIALIAPAGYYIALRIGFAFPMEEVNAFPQAWVSHYTAQRYMLFDPIVRWAYANTGVIHWSELAKQDPKNIIQQAANFGLRFGITIAVIDQNEGFERSFASFARSDREFSDLEVKVLQAYVARRHKEMAKPTNLTAAELEALAMVKDGKRLKEIAFKLNISEGAVKQRLRSGKDKLGAKTSTQAAALANQFGLI